MAPGGRSHGRYTRSLVYDDPVALGESYNVWRDSHHKSLLRRGPG